eukprot:12487688-Ditylum_brightwellii.AAC.1
MERSKQIEHAVSNIDNGVDNSIDNSVDNSVDNSDDGADKHLAHLSQAVDCCLMQRSKQNKHAVGNKDVGVDNGVDDSVDNNVDNNIDNRDDGANKHIAHLSQAVDCCLMQRSKQNKCVVGNKDIAVDDSVDNSVDIGVDDSVNNGVDDSVDNSDNGVNKHLLHLSQAVYYCLTERSEQNKCAVGNKKNSVDDSVGNSVDNSDDDSDDGVNKHLVHPSQAVDCCLMERSKQIKRVVGNKDNGVDNGVDNNDDSTNKQATHLKIDDCCLTERSKQHKRVDDDNGDDVGNSDDGANKHA